MTADLVPMSPKARREWFEVHKKNWYPLNVLEYNRVVTGWITISPHRPGRGATLDTGEISYFVDFNYHQMGFGSAMVRYALNEARELGFRVIFAIIIEGNQPSIRLLEKFGFENWGCLPQAVRSGDEIRSHIYLGKVLEHQGNEPDRQKLAGLISS